MIKQIIDVNGYWKVVVYYNVDYSLFHYVDRDLSEIDITSLVRKDMYDNMITGDAKAVTISNSRKRVSIVLFNNHKDKYDYINSIVHECEHIKQTMLAYYGKADKGEPPAYTIGYLVSRMYKIFANFYI